jgi:hypothetical protein
MRLVAARYGILLDASLITGIDPPAEVESALAAINTAHNQVSSDISLAQASADQKIVQSKRAVEIETLNAQAEVEPLTALAEQLARPAKERPGFPAIVPAQCAPQTVQPRTANCAGGGIMEAELVSFFIGAAATFFGMWFVMPISLFLLRHLGFYTTVQEGTCQVFILFGRVVGILKEPGLVFLPFKLGPSAFLVNWLGSRKILDMRLDQQYLRSNPVNSEEGAPMGVGIWYEMYISDPVSYLFKNADPRGSLAANVSNAVVRSLSNMPLDAMLVDRHA